MNFVAVVDSCSAISRVDCSYALLYSGRAMHSSLSGFLFTVLQFLLVTAAAAAVGGLIYYNCGSLFSSVVALSKRAGVPYRGSGSLGRLVAP